MRDLIDIVDQPSMATSALLEAPTFADLQGRDGRNYQSWINPTAAEFAANLSRMTSAGLTGLRGLMTEADLYVWQSVNVLHGDFERQTGIEGVRLGLRSGVVQANDETVGVPEEFPWIFPDAAAVAETDVAKRRVVVSAWLMASPRLTVIYPNGFQVVWYS